MWPGGDYSSTMGGWGHYCLNLSPLAPGCRHTQSSGGARDANVQFHQRVSRFTVPICRPSRRRVFSPLPHRWETFILNIHTPVNTSTQASSEVGSNYTISQRLHQFPADASITNFSGEELRQKDTCWVALFPDVARCSFQTSLFPPHHSSSPV